MYVWCDPASNPVSVFSRWQWIGRLKQPDGGFRVCEGGEEDVRYVEFLGRSRSSIPSFNARSDMSLMQWRILRYDSYLAT